MTDRLDRISDALNQARVKHACYHDCIHVHLPGEFGILEVKLWPDGSDSIQLLGGDFHTHTELLALEYSQDMDLVFATLILKILRHELLLIEESSAEGLKRKTIEESLDEYLRYLPDGATYRVTNET